ncbi:MAG: RRXRR domain-containing protein [Clostridiales bacterium]|nr:RRXRR domain-containing protein [Clostridiales bacterium]
MIYSMSKNGKPLMPTKRCGKVKRLIKRVKAKGVRLLYGSSCFTQPVALGIVAGSKSTGISAAAEKEELDAAEVQLRADKVDLLSTRRLFRHARRSGKTGHLQPRFNSRIRSKHKGWLAPSIENKIQTHIKTASAVHKILPIAKTVVEAASFDIQKFRNPDISGAECQNGEQRGFWNEGECVLFRDGHRCYGRKCCNNRMLRAHNIKSQKIGDDSPNDLITLRKDCRSDYRDAHGHHSGKLKLNLKRRQSFRDAAFMGIMRWAFCNRLMEMYPNADMTNGCIEKNTRIRNGLEKDHAVDARCISENPTSAQIDAIYMQISAGRRKRQLHKATINKGGKRKLNQAPKYAHGYQLFDKARMPDGHKGFIIGRRLSGGFDVRTLDGERISSSIRYKKLKPLTKRTAILTERRYVASSRLKAGVSAA